MSNAFSVEVREKSGSFQTCEGWETWNDGCTDMGADCGSNGAKTRRVPIYCFIVAEGFTPLGTHATCFSWSVQINLKVVQSQVLILVFRSSMFFILPLLSFPCP